jgi:hypothetical protein
MNMLTHIFICIHLAISPGARIEHGTGIGQVLDKGWSCEAKDVASSFVSLEQLCDKFARVVVAFNARRGSKLSQCL